MPKAGTWRSGQWIWERGLLDPARLEGFDGAPVAGEIERLCAEIDAPHGHDAFLAEGDALRALLAPCVARCAA